MRKTNRDWLPPYCQPSRFLPKIQETRALFSRPPYFFPEFLGKALTFLRSDAARKMGFEFDPGRFIPCKWKCSDESLFHVDLSLYAYTGLYPFDKGGIGGFLNESSLGAAVHHGSINLDFGGSHVGYVPGQGGGSFGYIWRPQEHAYSTNCGHMMSLLQPFKSVYDDACENILLYRPAGDKVLASIPNEFLQPNWSSRNVKLIVDLETLTAGEVEYQEEQPHTHTSIARSLFYVNPDFLEGLGPEAAKPFLTDKPAAIGRHLTPPYFNIFDIETEMDEEGLPTQGLLVYMKYILAAKHSPSALKASVINTNLEHSRLVDAVRGHAFIPYSFASFTGIFIDFFDKEYGGYLNLYQPIALTIKPSGSMQQTNMTPEEIHSIFDQIAPAEPKIPLGEILGFGSAKRLIEQFTYQPGRFRELET